MRSCALPVMGMKQVAMNFFLLFAIVSYNSAFAQILEVPDVTLIYTVHPPQGGAFPVDEEIHAETNSVGKYLVKNFTTMDPVLASQTIQNYPCIHSGDETPCKWTTHGDWTSEEMTHEDWKALSFEKKRDSFGGCQVSCAGDGCCCPPPFILNSDGRTCSTTVRNTHLLVQNEGIIESPNFPNSYPPLSITKWIIAAPGKLISLEIDYFNTETKYDILNVNGQIYSGLHSNLLIQSENQMELIFKSDNSNQERGFNASYRTEPIITMPTILSSVGRNTSLVFPMDHVPQDICLVVGYKLDDTASLEIFMDHPSSQYNTLSQRILYEVNGWQLGKFTANTRFRAEENATKLSVKCMNGQCKIFRIYECTSSISGDVYVTGTKNWTSDDFPKLWNGISIEWFTNCSNGGIYHSSSNLCVCPPGFTGNKCEVACGPNRYGDECSGVCSFFERRCRNMIFCNPLHICMCATGFTGDRCEQECENGYGPHCIIECGECIDGICDKFTGVCETGCRDGYYPPLCQERYVSMTDPPTIAEKSWNYVLLRINPRSVKGLGESYLYSIQFKEEGWNVWETTKPGIFEQDSFTANLTGLKGGTRYYARVVIFSDDGNSYQGSDIPEIEFITACQVPSSNDYQMKSRNVSSSSFTVEFNYEILNDTWCSVHSFEVTLQNRWRKFSKITPKSDLVLTYIDLLPGRNYSISICALTLNGRSPCSIPFEITTLEKAPGKVKHLTTESASSRSIHISWKNPLFSGGAVRGFRVNYQCIKDFSCNAACENSNGTIETTESSTIIDGLKPFSQYKIKVAAYTTNLGGFTTRFIVTNSEKPENVPQISEKPVISRSNSTATIQWESPSCLGTNGVFRGYLASLFKLLPNGNSSHKLFSRETLDEKITFTDLLPSTHYEVHVFTVNTHGWNQNYPLRILFSTSGTVPDAVIGLEVYKSGRRMLGIRWKKPSRTYGELKTFTVMYREMNGSQSFNETILPTPCKIWSDFYCHTIQSNLQQRKNYLVSVRARNNIIDEDGIESEITAQTTEFPPESPSYLRVLEANERSFEIEWGFPRKFNGELRSFLVNVEHTDAVNDEDCCENFPVQELPITEENLKNSLKIDGLVPASSYIISVSAKTVSLGPNINTTVNTPPVPVTSLLPPQITKLTEKSYSVKIIQPSNMNPRYKSLFLILVLPHHHNITSKIWRNDILEKINKEVNRDYYITAEIDFNEEQSEQTIVIGTGKNIQNGTIGELKDPELVPGEYEVGLILLQSFGDATSVSSKVSNSFEVSE